MAASVVEDVEVAVRLLVPGWRIEYLHGDYRIRLVCVSRSSPPFKYLDCSSPQVVGRADELGECVLDDGRCHQARLLLHLRRVDPSSPSLRVPAEHAHHSDPELPLRVPHRGRYLGANGQVVVLCEVYLWDKDDQLLLSINIWQWLECLPLGREGLQFKRS